MAIGEAMDRLDDDRSLVAGVITGAGGTFCAGMDLKAFLAGERPSIPGRGFAGIVEQPPVKPIDRGASRATPSPAGSRSRWPAT